MGAGLPTGDARRDAGSGVPEKPADFAALHPKLETRDGNFFFFYVSLSLMMGNDLPQMK